MAETVNDYMETDLGNVAPNPRGDYSETATYEYLDLVAYAGGSYMCILEDDTISGTAPTAGKTTEIWQEVSRPGDLTPEYVAMHDDVVNKAASVAEDAESVASDREQVEGMKENVTALQEQTAQDAQAAKEYRESAGGYASAAEQSRKATSASEENVRALVNGFDAHVEDQTQSAQEDITTSRQTAIKAIASQQVSSVNAVKQAAQDAITKTSENAEATAADRTAVTEMAATVKSQAEQTAKNTEQVAQDKATVEGYMKTAGESKDQAVEAAKQLNDSVEQVSTNETTIRTKAPAIVRSVTSESGAPVQVEGSAEMPLQGMRIYGKSEQVRTTGKNLLDADAYYATYKQADGTYKGTIDDFTKIFFPVPVYGEQITISVLLKSPVGTANVRVQVVKSNGDVLDGELNSNGTIGVSKISYIPTDGDKVHITYGSGGSGVCEFSNFQIEKGTEATSYEPYTGGKPSPSPEYPQEIESVGGEGEIGIKVTGKNLIPYPYSTQNGTGSGISYTVNKDQSVTVNGSATSNTVIRIWQEAATDLTKLSKKVRFTSGDIFYGLNIQLYVLYDNGNTDIVYLNNRIDTIGIFKPTESGWIAGVRIYITSGTTYSNTVFTPMLIKAVNGVYDETYEPYIQSASAIPTPNGLPAIPVPSGTTGITYTDSDGQAWIADEIDFKRGKYVRRVWKGEFDGSGDENWYVDGANTSGFCVNAKKENVFSRSGLSNQSGSVVFGWYSSASNVIRLQNLYGYYNASLDDYGLANWKAHLASNPLVVMTYLDTPIETDLTESQLEAYKSLTTFYPTSVISNDAGAQMEVEYAVDTETYINGLNNECNFNLDKLNETIAENKKSDELTQRRLDALWKLNQGVVYEFQSDNADAYQKDVPTGGRYAGLKQIGGKSFVWRQMVNPAYGKSDSEPSYGITYKNNGDGTWFATGTAEKNVIKEVANITPSVNHKYFLRGCPSGGSDSTYHLVINQNDSNIIYDYGEGIIFTLTDTANISCRLRIAVGGSCDGLFKPQLFDLTAMFGAGNEPATVAEFEALFPDSYYPYSAPEVVHAGVETVESVGKDSTNTLTIPESIRNLDGYGWSTGNVYNYVDFAEKKFHKRVGCVDLGALEWTSFSVTALDGVTFNAYHSVPKLNRPFQSGLIDYMCAKYKAINNRMASSGDGTISPYNTSNSNEVVVHDSQYTSSAAFKAAMSGVMLYYELATEEVTDISDLLAELDEDAFVLPVETSGTLTFRNALGDGYRIPVPNSEEYILKLSEVASNE